MQNSSDSLTQTQLREVLKYNPTTGAFTWRKTLSTHKKRGALAGSTFWDGTVFIYIDSTRYVAARLAYLYMTGAMPEWRVTHIDGNRRNNKWANLRLMQPAGKTAEPAKPAKRATIQRKQRPMIIGAGSLYRSLRARSAAQYTP